MNTYTKNVTKIMKKVGVPYNLTASGPSKIAKSKNNSFSMLAGPKYGCPGATPACKDCYAMKGRHQMAVVQTALGKNWRLMRNMEHNRAHKKALRMLLNIIPKNAKIFRIHESSDFYNQWYVNIWTAVIRSRPDVKFWAYTRSFHLNYQKMVRLPNFALWASTDSYNKVEATDFVKRYKRSNVKHAYGPWEHDRELPEGSFVCPVTTKKLALDGACEKCMLCVDKHRVKKNVVFLAH